MALVEVGTWTFWHESWVGFTGSVKDGVATVSYSNNQGNWYDTQVFYKIPSLNKGDKYNAKLHINNVPNDGKVTINGKIYQLKEGDNEIDLKTLISSSATSVTETDGVSVQIIFCETNKNNAHEIKAAQNLVIYVDGIEKVA